MEYFAVGFVVGTGQHNDVTLLFAFHNGGDSTEQHLHPAQCERFIPENKLYQAIQIKL